MPGQCGEVFSKASPAFVRFFAPRHRTFRACPEEGKEDRGQPEPMLYWLSGRVALRRFPLASSASWRVLCREAGEGRGFSDEKDGQPAGISRLLRGQKDSKRAS